MDELTGLSATVIEETELLSGSTRTHRAPAPAVSLSVTAPGEGRFQFRASSVDRVGNQSDWSPPVVSVIDSTGPVSSAPVARAAATDGGALVTVTWSLPTDALSAVAREELGEGQVDGGPQSFLVTGLSASRLVGPGAWVWALRATDSLGNVGAFSLRSNVIVVTFDGVSVGPTIDTMTLSARCGEALVVDLAGSGDAPLSWTLVAGPAGLTVDAAGRLSWTPPAGNAVRELATVRLTNGVGSVDGTLELPVSCSGDAGTPSPKPKTLGVGCGCSSLDALAVIALLALAGRRPRPRSS